MCGVIVVDAESFDLLVVYVMPIYMIMPRYSHNYALFYQLLDSNLFTHHNNYAILGEATSETYGPRVYSLSYKFPIYFILQSLLFNLYNKNTKNSYLIILSLSDLTSASCREGIDNPFIMLVARFVFVCVGAWDLWGSSYWIDTLVLKTEGNTYATLLHHPFLFKGKTNACSRGSKVLIQYVFSPRMSREFYEFISMSNVSVILLLGTITDQKLSLFVHLITVNLNTNTC